MAAPGFDLWSQIWSYLGARLIWRVSKGGLTKIFRLCPRENHPDKLGNWNELVWKGCMYYIATKTKCGKYFRLTVSSFSLRVVTRGRRHHVPGCSEQLITWLNVNFPVVFSLLLSTFTARKGQNNPHICFGLCNYKPCVQRDMTLL